MQSEEKWLLEEKYHGEKTDGFFADCKRLALGEPLGYIIGQTPFLGCTIWLDKHPLIPRPETEFWVEKAIEVISNQDEQPELFTTDASAVMLQRPQRENSERGQVKTSPQTRHSPISILDLCAGSGCIGVAIARALPAARVDFSEIDARLLSTIEKNIRANDLDPFTTTIYHSNLFSKIPSDKHYDFIVTNPPYIDPALDRTEPSVKTHEPHLALYGGRGGTEIIAEIIKAAPKHLRAGGQLWIEHEPEQTPFIAETAAEHRFSITTHKDQYHHDRYSILVLQ